MKTSITPCLLTRYGISPALNFNAIAYHPSGKPGACTTSACKLAAGEHPPSTPTPSKSSTKPLGAHLSHQIDPATNGATHEQAPAIGRGFFGTIMRYAPEQSGDPKCVELRGFEPLTPSMRTRC